MSVLLDDIKHLQFEPMKNHTTFRIGGPAKHFYMPASVEELILVIGACRKSNEKYMILGNGSNVLFMDQGYDGVIIQIYSNMNSIKIEDDVIYAEAGALLSKVASFARDNELTGMEFAAGIPGTLGGAVVMNAGAYGGEMKDIIEYVDVLEEDLTVKRYLCDEMEFGYRHSIVEGSKVVLGVAIKLAKGDVESINKKMAELKEARVSKQPLEYPSAGSTFKRPEGYFAGKLIEDSGLKGHSVGGAMVSTKHSGFVINYDNATSSDVLTLISDVQNVVYDKYGVKLEPEVRIIT